MISATVWATGILLGIFVPKLTDLTTPQRQEIPVPFFLLQSGKNHLSSYRRSYFFLFVGPHRQSRPCKRAIPNLLDHDIRLDYLQCTLAGRLVGRSCWQCFRLFHISSQHKLGFWKYLKNDFKDRSIEGSFSRPVDWIFGKNISNWTFLDGNTQRNIAKPNV